MTVIINCEQKYRLNDYLINLLMGVRLSSKGIRNIESYLTEKDFSFICSEKVYECSKVFAVFCAPRVLLSLQSDGLMNSFCISDQDNSFEKFLCLVRGEEIALNTALSYQLFSIAQQLGNNEVMDLCKTFLSKNVINISNVIDLIVNNKKCGLPIENEISFLIGEISNIKLNKLFEIDPYIIRDILNHPQFPEESKNVIIAQTLKTQGNKAQCLVELLNPQTIDDVILSIILNVLNPSEITVPIWELMFQILNSKQTRVPISKPSMVPTKSVNFDSKVPLEGIINDFRKRCRKNPHDSQMIVITPSSKVHLEAHKIIDPHNKEYWLSDDTPFTNDTPNFTIDFKKRKVLLKSYTLKTLNYPAGNYHMKSWVVEISCNGSEWKIIHSVQNSPILNSKAKIENFSVSQSEECIPSRYIRIRMTEENYYNTKQMCLAGIEVFGDIFEEQK